MDPSGLLNKLRGGDISNIISDVKVALDGPGNSALAHRAIVRISNLCISSTGRTEPLISDDDVALQLAKSCCQAIIIDIKGASTIEPNSRTISSAHNLLHRFQENGNVSCAIKLLNDFLPILEKMLFSENEHKVMIPVISLVRNILLSASDNIFKENLKVPKESNLLELWDLMLRVAVLVKAEISVSITFSVLREISVKYESFENNVNKMLTFHKALVEKLVTFFKIRHNSFIVDEDILDKVFKCLAPALWQLLRIDIKSDSIGNAHHTVQSISKCVASFVPAHVHHMKCFNLISRVLGTFFIQADALDTKQFVKETEYFVKVLKEHEKKGLSSAMRWVLYFCGSAIISMEKIISRIAAMKSFFCTQVLSALCGISKCVSKLLLTSSNSVCRSSSGETCPLKLDVVQAFSTLSVCVSLSVEFKKNKEEWVEIWPLLQDVLDELQSILNIANSKCVRAKVLEKTLYDHYFSVGTLCYKAEDWKHSQKFLLQALNYLLTIWETANNVHHQKLLAIVSKLYVCFEKQGLKKEAQAVILIHVVKQLQYNAPQDQYLRHCWSSLQNEEQSKARTSDEFVSQESLLIKSICPSFQFSSNLLPNLLLWELSCYVFFRRSNTDVILEAWLTLKDSNPPAFILLQGLALALNALFFIKDTKEWHKMLSVSLPLLLTQIKLCEKSVGLCSVAIHYHMKFLTMAQRHFDENESRVKEESSVSINPVVVKLPGEVVDPSDVCLVQSTFKNLNINQESKLMATLDCALNYWNESLEAVSRRLPILRQLDGLNEADYSQYPVVSLSGELLMQAAFFYTLWGYHAGAAKAWHICCKFARKMHQDDLLLQALSGLMNTVEVNQECIAEADALLNRLCDHPKHSYLHKMFSTSRAFQALRTKTYNEGIEALKNVVNFVPSQSSVWCFTYAKLLQASYALLPKSLVDLKGLGENGVVSLVYDGLRYSMQQVRSQRLSSSPQVFAAVVSQALSSSLWIGRFYLRSKMPREARCFLKAELQLALKMGLATRAAEFICELAFIDLLTEKVDETRIVEIESILGKDYSLVQDEDDLPQDHGMVSDENNQLKILPDNKERNAASPLLQKRFVFHLPFIHHDPYCKCYTCCNVSVQLVWLIYNHLLAKTSVLKFWAHEAKNIYSMTLRTAMSVLQKLQQDSSLPGILLQQHQLACTVICLRLDLVDLLAMYEKDYDAFKRNKATLSFIHDLNTHENQLLVEALDQKMSLVRIIEKKEGKPTESESSQAEQLLSLGGFIEKTPERNVNIETPTATERKRRPLKPLKSPNQVIVPKTDQQFFTPKVSLNLNCVIGTENDENLKDSVTPEKRFKTAKATINELSPDMDDSHVNSKMCIPEIRYNGESYKDNANHTSKIPHLKSTRGFKSKVDVKTDNIPKISSNKSVVTDDKILNEKNSTSQKTGRSRNAPTYHKQPVLRPVQSKLSNTASKTSDKAEHLDQVDAIKSKKYISSKSVVEKEVILDKVEAIKSKKQLPSKSISVEKEVKLDRVEAMKLKNHVASKSVSAEKEVVISVNTVESLKPTRQVSSKSHSGDGNLTRKTRQRRN